MCFGNTVTTEQKQTNNTLPGYLETAAQGNIANAQNVTSKPFTPYTGQLTAPQSPDELSAAGMLRTVAGSSNPYTSDIQSLYKMFGMTPGGTVSAPSILGPGTDVNSSSISDYMSPYTSDIQSLYKMFGMTPGGTVSAPSILGPGTDVNSSSISDYMNPYTSAVLNPQLADIDRQSAAQQKQLNAQATFGGAFGDSRNGVQAAQQTYDTNRLRADTIGGAYSNAFNTAAGLRGADISNSLNVQNQNNANKETALQRAAVGGTDLMNLDKYDTGRTTDLAQALARSGATARGVNQTADTAQLQEFMRKVGYDPQMLQLLTSVLAGTPHDTSSNSTTQAPDNTGYALLGALLGAGGQAAKAFAVPGAPSAGGGAPLDLSSGTYYPGNIGGTGGSLGGLY